MMPRRQAMWRILSRAVKTKKTAALINDITNEFRVGLGEKTLSAYTITLSHAIETRDIKVAKSMYRTGPHLSLPPI